MGDTKTKVHEVPSGLRAVAWPKAVLKAHAGQSPVTGAPARPQGDAHRPWEIRNAADDSGAEILLYDEIGGWGIWAEDFARDLAQITARTITVRVNSPGGDVWDGIAIMNALIEHPASVTIRVDGLAASIASVICLAGDRVVMGHSATMMIHNASTLAWGEAADLRQTADLLEKISCTIAEAYADRTSTPVEEWQARMDAETWLTAQECVALGLADEVAPLPARDAAGDGDTGEAAQEAGHDPDPENRSVLRPAAGVTLRPAARLEATDTATGDIGAPIDASTTVIDASTESVDEPADEPAEGDGPSSGDAAVLGQALAWWLAIDQVADRALAQISAALGVPNPDDDSGEPPPPLPSGDAGLALLLGMLTSVDTVVDGAQVIVAKALGVPNPDPDADDPDRDGEPTPEDASATGVTASAEATTDTPGTGATAHDEWADITASFTTTAPATAAAFTLQEGAWWE